MGPMILVRIILIGDMILCINPLFIASINPTFSSSGCSDSLTIWRLHCRSQLKFLIPLHAHGSPHNSAARGVSFRHHSLQLYALWTNFMMVTHQKRLVLMKKVLFISKQIQPFSSILGILQQYIPQKNKSTYHPYRTGKHEGWTFRQTKRRLHASGPDRAGS